MTGFFPPYLSEEESEQYEEEYLSDLKNFVFVEASEQNLKTYLGGNGKSTGYTKADLES